MSEKENTTLCAVSEVGVFGSLNMKDPTANPVKKLMEDNTQLFNENQRLQAANLKLKEVIDQKIPRVEDAIQHINEKVETFTTVLSEA